MAYPLWLLLVLLVLLPLTSFGNSDCHSLPVEDRLLAWIRSNDGFVTDKIGFVVCDGVRKLPVRADITQGDPIIAIPIKLHQVLDLAMRDYALPREVAKVKEWSLQHTALAAHITREVERHGKGARSRQAGMALSVQTDDHYFAPYWEAVALTLDSMEAQASMPFYRSADELDLLKGSPEHYNVVHFHDWFARDYSGIINNFFRHCPKESNEWCAADIGTFNKSTFVSASFFITSRAFAARGQWHIVPVADEALHEVTGKESATWYYDDDVDLLKLDAKRNISAGEEVSISYGHRSNAHLFATYGFTLPAADVPLLSYRLWAFQLPSIIAWELLTDEVGEAIVDLRLQAAPLEGHFDEGEKPFLGLRHLIRGAHAGAGTERNSSTATDALNAVVEHFIAKYEADMLLKPFLRQLRANREKSSSSWVWWADQASTEALFMDAPEMVGGKWRSDVVRTKMCEYMCLLAHREMLRLWNGVLKPAAAIPQASALLQPFKELLAEFEVDSALKAEAGVLQSKGDDEL